MMALLNQLSPTDREALARLLTDTTPKGDAG
jgi:hypothetical protein